MTKAKQEAKKTPRPRIEKVADPLQRVFLVKTPIKNFRCNEARAKEYVEAEAKNEDVDLEVFEVTTQKNGEEKLTQVGVADF